MKRCDRPRHMPQTYYPTVRFPIDQIVARQHGGRTAIGNLALSDLHVLELRDARASERGFMLSLTENGRTFG
jgi:hypothetical protein